MNARPQPRNLLLLMLTLVLAGLLVLLLQVGLASAMDARVTHPTAMRPQAEPTDDLHKADVVVDLGNGRTIIRHIAFTSATISGLQALQLTGLDLEIAHFSFGSAVCSIEGVGCPATDCFCNPDKFWGYQYWDGTTWQPYTVGASDSVVGDGAVEGWNWGPWGDTPPDITREKLAAEAALQWMRPQQAADGSYGHNAGATLDVLLAVAAANHDPMGWQSASGYSLLDYLATAGRDFAQVSAAAAGKLALGLAAADQDPRRFAGLDLVNTLTTYYSPTVGAFGSTNIDQALAILGLAAAGADVPPQAARYLAQQANPDGGWGWLEGVASDVDSTSLALQALVATGEPLTSTAIVSGLAFLHTAQNLNPDGGFAHSPDLSWGRVSNVNSTAFAVQALLATGQDPLSATWTVSNSHPISYLLSKQLPEGAFPYVDPPANLFATQQAVPALLGKPFPYRSRQVAVRKALDWIASQQQDDGSFAGFGTGTTIDAVLAIVAGGRDPNAFVSSAGNTPLDFLATQAGAYAAQGASAAGKLAAGLVAAGADPRHFGGVDVVAAVENTYANGQYGGGTTWDQAWAIIGLAAAGEQVPISATQYLKDIQASGGGWGFTAHAANADVDSTGLALQALAAAGVGPDDAAVQAGLAFLHRVQNADGGFPGFTGATDAASSGLALQALTAYGEDPRGLQWTTIITDGSASRLTLHTPVDAVLALQSPQGGLPGFSGPNDPFSTYQAVPGIAGKPLPLRPPVRYYFPVLLR